MISNAALPANLKEAHTLNQEIGYYLVVTLLIYAYLSYAIFVTLKH